MSDILAGEVDGSGDGLRYGAWGRRPRSVTPWRTWDPDLSSCVTATALVVDDGPTSVI
ncbi:MULTISPECIES: hypothetical protein [unclassified Streptomyces]|uniref:hypothetical protein n=1 Tax=unclassified Streptomyces TaxID=2593676 RepID=UPI0035D723E2